MSIEISGDDCRDEAVLSRLEWLEADGLGGYASSTVLTSHSRKYHGLLVANLPPPAAGRYVLLSKYEESLLTPAGERFLTCHHYPGVLFPTPAALPAAFELDDVPAWTYRLDGCELRREILMPRGRACVLVRYLLTGTEQTVVLRLKPLLAFRSHHALMRANDAVRGGIRPLADGFAAEPYGGMPALFFQWPAGTDAGVRATGLWYRDFEYHEERRRGFDFREDLFNPATAEITLQPGQPLVVAAGIAELAEPPDELWRAETARRQDERRAARRAIRRRTANLSDIETAEQLFRAAGQFAIRTPAGRPALLAGYPWFEDWGRDTMIALPGAMFLTGRLGNGLDILLAFSRLEKNGLLPNFINPDGSASYNSVDASLWFFHAVQQYLKAGGDPQPVRDELWPVMRRITAAYAAGIADPPVRMDERGLLHAGTRGTQLTWMDAKVDGRPVTPRWGCAVEINALWYNALCFCREVAKTLGDKEFKLPVAPETVAGGFRETFWLPREKHLADCVNEDGADRSLRPNQIFAAALPHSPLTAAQARAVAAAVAETLLTPCGLRTLAPSEPGYRPRYEGDGRTRDAAYHQGTAWPWLFGAFAEAHLRVAGGTPAATARLREWMGAWPRHLAEAGIGSVSEVADAEPPHRPNGCISQAWSVGEVIRAYHLLWEAEQAAKPAAKRRARTPRQLLLGL